MTAIGEWAMWLALALAAATVILSVAGALRERSELAALARGTTYATLAAIFVVVTGLFSALFARDFTLRFVATNTSVNLPRLYTGAALWAGQQGSLLFWILGLSACAAVAALQMRKADPHRSWVIAVLGAVVLYFLGVLVTGANPFVRMDWAPADGLGMSPRLQVPAMLLHPPLLTAALVSTSVPFAFALGALITRRYDTETVRRLYGWSVLAWFLLTLSILHGLWWDYTAPEWSGRWPRDIARDSVLLPWLGSSALLYAAKGSTQRSVPRVRLWIMALAVMTFVLALASAYLARAGTIDSVHAYAPSPMAKGFLILGAIAVLLLIHLVRTRLVDFSAELANASAVTRSSGFMPRAHWPLLVGVVILFTGLAGLMFRKEARLTLATGASENANDPLGRTWTFTSQGISLYTELNKQLLVASLSLGREGRRVGMLTAEQRQFIDAEENLTSKPIAVPDIDHSLLQDVRVSLLRPVDRGTALIQIEFVPLASWIWFGGLLTAIGGVVLAMSNQPKHNDDDAVPSRVSNNEVEAAIRRASEALVSCPECGPRPEPDALYCSNCGMKLRAQS